MALDSDVEICNYAISTIRSNVTINSLSDRTSQYAVDCNRIYANHRDGLLSERPWSFGKQQADIHKIADTDNTYQIPGDCLRILDFGGKDDRVDWDIHGDRLIVDGTVETPTLTYIKRVTNPALMSPLFKQALAYRIAIDLASSYESDQVVNLTIRYNNILDEAARKDVKQVVHDIQPTSWQLAHRRYTRSRGYPYN